jgi:hypothetical protein
MIKEAHDYIISPHLLRRTYFDLLPRELYHKISDYYYGPIELTLEQYEEGTTSVVTFRRYTSTESGVFVDVKTALIITFDNLIAMYKSDPTSGRYSDERYRIRWDSSHTMIRIGVTNIYLHDYLSQLFWQKVLYISNMIEIAKSTNRYDILDYLRA